jgi:hypothetical protein
MSSKPDGVPSNPLEPDDDPAVAVDVTVDENEDDFEIDTVWNLEVVNLPGSSTSKSQYFWTITDEEKLPKDQWIPGNDSQAYGLLWTGKTLDDSLEKLEKDMYFARWDRIKKFTDPSINWAGRDIKMRTVNARSVTNESKGLVLDNFNISVRKPEEFPFSQNDKTCVAFFNHLFEQGQEIWKKIRKMNLSHWYWKPIDPDSNPVLFKSGKLPPASAFPGSDSKTKYIRLSWQPRNGTTGDAIRLLQDDRVAFLARGVRRGSIYIDQGTCTQLRGVTAEYDWEAQGNTLMIRDGTGGLNYLVVQNPENRSTAFWTGALEYALTHSETSLARYRNPTIELLFVVVNGSRVDNLKEFGEMIESIKNSVSGQTINQQFKVVHAKDAESFKAANKFDVKVSNITRQCPKYQVCF